jgi:hypothetical protein
VAEAGLDDFLKSCVDGCPPGLDCIRGLCTRACRNGPEGDQGCRRLASGAVCSTVGLEPGRDAVCGVDCGSDADCAGLGANYYCGDGACRSEEPAQLECASYLDQQPGSDAWIDVTIRNDRSQAIYLTPYLADCNDPGHFVRTERNRREVWLREPLRCGGLSCEDVQRTGDTAFGCNDDCPSAPMVRLEPGSELNLERFTTEYLRHGFEDDPVMPLECVPRTFDGLGGVGCISRAPVTPGVYRLTAQAYPRCVAFGAQSCSCTTPMQSGSCSVGVTVAPNSPQDSSLITARAEVDTLPARVVLAFDD